ncbi:flagellar biosynthetic protein FliQ [Pseudomonas sp. Marseille-QA0892]
MLTPDGAVAIIANAVQVIVIVVSVLVVPSLIGGLLISIFQAATQINEQMLSFLPRLLITLGMLVFAGHWILSTLSDLFIETFHQASRLVG